MALKPACLLIECGHGYPPDLLQLLDTSGFEVVRTDPSEAGRREWRLSLLTVNAESWSLAKDLLTTLVRDFGIPVVLVLLDPQGVPINELLLAGATDFISPPFHAATVLPRIQRAEQLHTQTCDEDPQNLTAELGMMGKSASFLAEMRKLPAVAQCDVTVLIDGETGTGKELLARAIHTLSPRRRESFVPVDCGAIPQDLAESELFGHEKGSFTGASAKTTGLIRSADRGTLFLDEVDSLSLANQAKFLRFLQCREYRSVGSSTLQHSDVRVISATHTDLRQGVSDGTFREDLFYRLKVVRMRLPPLRDRGEDIVLLAQHFVIKYAERFKRPTRGISRDGIARLLAHRWPGNIREVENVIEAAVALSQGEWIAAGDIAFDGMEAAQDSLREAKARAVQEFERGYIIRLLRTYEGNISEAARAAKKNRRAFWELIRKHKVCADEYRRESSRKGPVGESSSSTSAATG
jgi:two-component system, NtrC family, response regulator GlrR